MKYRFWVSYEKEVLANDDGSIYLIHQDDEGTMTAEEARFSCTEERWFVDESKEIVDTAEVTEDRGLSEWAYEMGWQVLEVR